MRKCRGTGVIAGDLSTMLRAWMWFVKIALERWRQDCTLMASLIEVLKAANVLVILDEKKPNKMDETIYIYWRLQKLIWWGGHKFLEITCCSSRFERKEICQLSEIFIPKFDVTVLVSLLWDFDGQDTTQWVSSQSIWRGSMQERPEIWRTCIRNWRIWWADVGTPRSW